MTDVAVVGAGVTGLVAAAALARRGMTVVVYDEGGGVAGESGLLLPGLADAPSRVRAALGAQRCGAILDLATQGRSHVLATGAAREGEILYVPCSAVERDDLASSAADVEARPAGARWPDGTWRVPGGAVSPSGVHGALLAAARTAGADIRTGVHVVHVERSSGATALRAATGPLPAAEIVLIAAGLGTAPLSAAAGAHLHPLRGQAVSWDPARGTDALGAVRRWGHEEYAFRADGVRMLAWRAEASPADLALPAVYDGTFESHAVRSAEWVGGRREPRPRSRRAHAFCWSRDGLPLAGPLAGEPRIWLAAGFGSRSLTFGAGCALAIARALAGEGDAIPAFLGPRRLVSGGDPT